MEKSNILGTEKISKLFVKFSIPAIISMVISGMQTMIDGMFLGNFVGPNAMASVNLVQPFTQVIIGFSMIISIGSLSFIGRSLGEGNNDKAQNIFKTSFIFMLAISAIISIVGFLFSDSIAVLLGANDVLIESVSIYVKTISIFAVSTSIMFLFGFIDRVIGRPDLFLKGTIVSLIVNIVLDYILLKELNMGISGAAIATGIAFLSALFIVIWPMIDKKSIVNIFIGSFDKSVIIPVAYNGSSEGVTSIATATTSYVFNMAFMKIAGESGVAAFTTISYISQFGTLIMFGISDGIGPIISYNFGDKKYDRVKSILKLSDSIILGVGIILFVIIFAFGKTLVSMFAGGNKDVLELAVNGSKIYAFAFFINGFNIVNSGYFTSIGDAKASIIIAASRGIIFIILGIIILPMILGTSGIWLTVPFAELMTFIIGVNLITKNKSGELNYTLDNI